jgi:drug/metabolite transporter (DMT)-like permease
MNKIYRVTEHLNPINYLLLLGIGVIWGSQFLFNKWAIDTFPPTTMAASRSLIGAITLSLCLFKQRDQTFFQSFYGPWSRYFIIGFTEAAIPFSLVAWGQEHIVSGIAAVLMGTIPIFTIILTKIFIPTERLGIGSWVSVIIGFIGIWVLTSPTSNGGLQNSTWAEFAILGAALSFSISMILINKLPTISPIATTRNILIAACIYLVPAALIIDQPWKIHISTTSLLSLFILGTMCGGIVYVMYVLLIMRAGVTFTSLNNYLVPVVGVIIGTVFLGEHIEWNVIVALVLIIISLMTNEFGKGKKVQING